MWLTWSYIHQRHVQYYKGCLCVQQAIWLTWSYIHQRHVQYYKGYLCVQQAIWLTWSYIHQRHVQYYKGCLCVQQAIWLTWSYIHQRHVQYYKGLLMCTTSYLTDMDTYTGDSQVLWEIILYTTDSPFSVFSISCVTIRSMWIRSKIRRSGAQFSEIVMCGSVGQTLHSTQPDATQQEWIPGAQTQI